MAQSPTPSEKKENNTSPNTYSVSTSQKTSPNAHLIGSKGPIMSVIRGLNTQDNHIITPFRYSMVEEGVFRGAYPTPRNFRFLKRFQEILIMPTLF